MEALLIGTKFMYEIQIQILSFLETTNGLPVQKDIFCKGFPVQVALHLTRSNMHCVADPETFKIPTWIAILRVRGNLWIKEAGASVGMILITLRVCTEEVATICTVLRC